MAAITRPFSLEAMHSTEEQNNFEIFQLEIDNFRCYGSISNHSLFAHKALGKEPICSYLRAMDLKEYEQVLKEHDQLGEVMKPSKGPIITGIIITVSGCALATFVAGPFGGVCATIKAAGAWSGFFGAAGGALHYGINCKLAGESIDEDRANRLTVKVYSLSERISSLDHSGGNSEEVIQLRVAHDYFQRAVQKFANRITVVHTR